MREEAWRSKRGEDGGPTRLFRNICKRFFLSRWFDFSPTWMYVATCLVMANDIREVMSIPRRGFHHTSNSSVIDPQCSTRLGSRLRKLWNRPTANSQETSGASKEETLAPWMHLHLVVFLTRASLANLDGNSRLKRNSKNVTMQLSKFSEDPWGPPG